MQSDLWLAHAILCRDFGVVMQNAGRRGKRQKSVNVDRWGEWVEVRETTKSIVRWAVACAVYKTCFAYIDRWLRCKLGDGLEVLPETGQDPYRAA